MDHAFVRILVAVLAGWRDRQQHDVIAYLIEDNRALRTQLGTRRVRLTDAQRRRLARRGKRLGRLFANTRIALLPPWLSATPSSYSEVEIPFEPKSHRR
jgi:hypothetical protein